MNEEPDRTEGDRREVAETVERLVAAFGQDRVDDYFACFHPDCSFVFHTTGHRLESAAEYHDLWDHWKREDGLEVRSCRTYDARIQLWGDAAVVTHSVETRVYVQGAEQTTHERETIVLVHQPDGRWLGVHEHLSPLEPSREG